VHEAERLPVRAALLVREVQPLRELGRDVQRQRLGDDLALRDDLVRSWIWTMLRCESAEWMRASVSSIFTKRSSSARSGRMRLIATYFSKPSAPTTRPL
jgi:hypothetical protein